MSVLEFPGPAGATGDRSTVAGAVDRFLDSLQAATTRAGYAATLARLVAVTGPHHPVAAWSPSTTPR